MDRIIEIGTEYGGFCLVLSILAKEMGHDIKNYCIYDLPEAEKFQQAYLTDIHNVEWKDCTTFGEDANDASLLVFAYGSLRN